MKPRLLIYFTLGFPDDQFLVKLIRDMPDGLVDGLELGLPSADPRYDGPKIRLTHIAAKSRELERFDPVLRVCGERGIRVNILSYYSDFENNERNILSFLSRHSVHEIIVPDLLIDYADIADPFLKKLQSAGISYIPFFNAATPDRVIEKYMRSTNSWIYYGLQPSTGINMPLDIQSVVERATSLLRGRDIIFGFGIRNGQDAARIIEAGGHGIAIATALIDDINRHDADSVVHKIEEYRRAIDFVV